MSILLKSTTRLSVAILFAFTVLFQVSAQELEFEFKQANIALEGIELTVEYADTYRLRAQGLQFRKELCENCGMLFKFDRSRIVAMWMKNTLIPLDVAFIAKDGTIVNIEQMKPLDLTSVPSKGEALYALEMNEHWFEKQGIKAGVKVQRLP